LPDVHGEDAVRDLNWLFKLIASIPFCSTKLPPRRLRQGRAVAKEESTRVAKTETFMANVYWYVVDFSGVGVYRGFVQDQLVKVAVNALETKKVK
jgi:hypothetical protein